MIVFIFNIDISRPLGCDLFFCPMDLQLEQSFSQICHGSECVHTQHTIMTTCRGNEATFSRIGVHIHIGTYLMHSELTSVTGNQKKNNILPFLQISCDRMFGDEYRDCQNSASFFGCICSRCTCLRTRFLTSRQAHPR